MGPRERERESKRLSFLVVDSGGDRGTTLGIFAEAYGTRLS